MTDSPPPTPPSRSPSEKERRFKPISSPCEWIEDYHPGGYHPVHLGDLFHHNLYKVIRKLGEGSYSTVWLARDLKHNKYVALKILVSETPNPPTELQILHHLAAASPSQHITQLLDNFTLTGPNGTHTCLVFEPMGPSASAMVEELPQFNPRKYGMKVRYPPRMAKEILRQSLQALAFLHENGIAHGDFQPGNMLFALDGGFGLKAEGELQQDENVETRSISPPVQSCDGKQDLWAPRYLCVAQPLAGFTPYVEGFKVKLSDMGGAYFFTDPPANPVTPYGLRTPELVLSGTVDRSLDVWSFGCLVFELVTGQPLIHVPGCEDEADDYLLVVSERLGPLPDALYEKWETRSLYFTPERKLFNCSLGGVGEGEEPLMLEQKSMEEYFDEAGVEIGAAEAGKVKALIRRILKYDPAERPSAAEILLDPWFCGEDSDNVAQAGLDDVGQ